MDPHTRRRSHSRGFVARPATSDGLGASGVGVGNGRIHTILGIGVRFEYVGFKGLQARLRERTNKRLKSKISAPRDAWHGEDDVVANWTSNPPRVIRDGNGYVLVSRYRKAKGKERDIDGDGGLGEEI